MTLGEAETLQGQVASKVPLPSRARPQRELRGEVEEAGSTTHHGDLATILLVPGELGTKRKVHAGCPAWMKVERPRSSLLGGRWAARQMGQKDGSKGTGMGR